MKEFEIHVDATFIIEAENDTDATGRAYEMLKDMPFSQFDFQTEEL